MSQFVGGFKDTDSCRLYVKQQQTNEQMKKGQGYKVQVVLLIDIGTKCSGSEVEAPTVSSEGDVVKTKRTQSFQSHVVLYPTENFQSESKVIGYVGVTGFISHLHIWGVVIHIFDILQFLYIIQFLVLQNLNKGCFSSYSIPQPKSIKNIIQ